MKQFKKHIMITGGAGFIGSHLVRRFVTNYPDYRIINVDKLTYAGNLENLIDIEHNDNYVFEKADILDKKSVTDLFSKYTITDVIHLAAESHVDRSIEGPMEFVLTNVVGTVTLLEAAKDAWTDHSEHVFYQVSTDEVFGSLESEGFFTEKTPYDPRSPYSASKASSDHFVRAYFHTFQLPVKMSNCSNNYGSHHFPEKLIPLMINNILNEKPLPIYGNGLNIRDWLWVEDHASAIDAVFHKGKIGESYNIGGLNEWTNIDLVMFLCQLMDQKLGKPEGSAAKLITYIKDRAGHDQRYAIDASKISDELGWTPSINFEDGLSKTIDWYLANKEWIDKVTSGSYQNYYDQQYNNR
jgi:dTDP-glucose 4,6-dehydratase